MRFYFDQKANLNNTVFDKNSNKSFLNVLKMNIELVKSNLFYIRCTVVDSAIFQKQPPDNLRKSNFFNFILVFRDRLGNSIEVQRASYVEFIENETVSATQPFLFIFSKPTFSGGAWRKNKQWGSLSPYFCS